MDIRITKQFDEFTVDISEVPASKLDEVLKGATLLAFGLPKKATEFAVPRERIVEAIKTHFNNGHQPQYINAIKFVRILTHLDLKTAKALVDEVRAVTASRAPGTDFSSVDLPR